MPIRVLLAEMPRLLGDIVADVIAGQPDMVLAMAAPDESVEAAIARERPDVVVIAAEEGVTSSQMAPLLFEFPRIRWLVVGSDGREAALYELAPQKVQLSEVSPTGLADAVRLVMRGGGWDPLESTCRHASLSIL